MKFYWTIFISFFILIATAFSICGTWMISASFRASYHREIESGNSKNEMVRMSLGNIVGSMPADYFTKHKNAMKEICSSFAVSFGGDSDFFTIYDDRRNVVYSSGKPQNNDVLFTKAGKNKSARKIYKSKDTYYLRIVSYTILPSDLKGYYVETVTNINNIYLQRQEMTRMYHYIMFIILVSCMILSLALSYFLTYRVRVLSASTRSFADGDLNSRVQVHGQDEIATLAADFNRMADSLQEKIDEISMHAKNQEAFTAAFAHELKTPLTSIIGYAELLRTMDLSQEEKWQAADYIFSQGKRLESLSYKLLDLFVLQQQELTFAPVSSSELTDAIVPMMKQNLAAKDVMLSMHLAPATLYGDKDLLLSLLINLIDNARKASSSGDTITVLGYSDNDYYCISVQDTGKGIPADEIDKITKPFYMVDKSRSRKEGGAGLGMSLCYEILRLHHAQWHIESELHVGTTITITIPQTGKE